MALEAAAAEAETATGVISGLSGFCLDYEVQWPVSLVLNRKVWKCSFLFESGHIPVVNPNTACILLSPLLFPSLS